MKILFWLFFLCFFSSCYNLKNNAQIHSKKEKNTDLNFSFNVDSTFSETIILTGKITEAETDDPVIFGNVAIYRNDKLITGTETNFDGNYQILNLETGIYDVEVSYVGFPTIRIEGVSIKNFLRQELNIQLSGEADITCRPNVLWYPTLFQIDNMTNDMTFRKNDIKNKAVPRN